MITPPEVIYSSDLQRALQSARLIAERFVAPLYVRPQLREIGFGQWEGLCWQQVQERFPSEALTWMDGYPDGVISSGERYGQFRSRVREEMSFLIEDAKTRTVVAVTHAGFIRIALTDLDAISHDAAFNRSASYACIVSIQSVERSRK